MAVNKGKKEKDRLAASLATNLPDSGGGYMVSAAFLAPEQRRLVGLWSVSDHLVEGRPYLEHFAENALRGAVLVEPVYTAFYEFKPSICVKRVEISGLVEVESGRSDYSFRMSVAISWDLGRGFILVKPELGYQTSSLGGVPAAVRELAASGDESRIAYRFEDGVLVLEEGSDLKRLHKVK